MKWIKTYKLFESTATIDRIAIRKYLEDILIELCDIGYNHCIGIYNNDVTITLTKPRVENNGLYQQFEYSEVKDCIWSCIDYMEGNGYTYKHIICFSRLGSNLVKVNDEEQNVQMMLNSLEVKLNLN
jgi:hypothetical protein